MKPLHLGMPTGRPAEAWWGHRSPAWARLLALVLVALGLLGLGHAVVQTLQLQAEARALQRATLQLAASPAQRPWTAAGAPPARTAAARPVAEPVKRAYNQVVRQLNMPWPAVLDALEKTLPAGVAVMAIEPDAAQGSVELQLEGRSLQDLLAHATTLQATAPFGELLLLKHETSDRDPQRPVRLQLELRLAGATTRSAAGGEVR